MKRQDLAIASPCAMDWNTMTTEGRKRFCDACKKHVHDLSSMKKDDAVALLRQPPAEGLCVRYLYNAYGEILFDMVDTRIVPASRLVRARRVLESGAAAAGVALSLAACGGQPAEGPHVPTGAMMGEPPAIPIPTTSSTAPAMPSAAPSGSTAAPPVPQVK